MRYEGRILISTRRPLFKDSSTLYFSEFLREGIIYAIIGLTWYRVIFRCIPVWTYWKSLGLLGLMLCISVLLADLLFLYQRTEKTVIYGCFVPFGIYTCLIYWHLLKIRIITLSVFAVLLTVAYCMLVCFRKIGNGNRKRIMLRRAYRCLTKSFSVLAITSACLCVPLFFQAVFTGGILKSSVKAETEYIPEEIMIEKEMDTLLLLQEQEWVSLVPAEKLAVLQTVANIERSYFGIPVEITVVAGKLKENTLGQYNDSTHTISISIDVLENSDASESLEVLTHECQHAYQARLVDAYQNANAVDQQLRLYNAARSYSEEYADYEDGYSSFSDYYSQACESDAREYSYRAVDYYYRIIDEYLAGKD